MLNGADREAVELDSIVSQLLKRYLFSNSLEIWPRDDDPVIVDEDLVYKVFQNFITDIIIEHIRVTVSLEVSLIIFFANASRYGFWLFCPSSRRSERRGEFAPPLSTSTGTSDGHRKYPTEPRWRTPS